MDINKSKIKRRRKSLMYNQLFHVWFFGAAFHFLVTGTKLTLSDSFLDIAVLISLAVCIFERYLSAPVEEEFASKYGDSIILLNYKKNIFAMLKYWVRALVITIMVIYTYELTNIIIQNLKNRPGETFFLAESFGFMAIYYLYLVGHNILANYILRFFKNKKKEKIT